MRYLLTILLAACVDQVDAPAEPPIHEATVADKTFYTESLAEGCDYFASLACADDRNTTCARVARLACCRNGCNDEQVYAPARAYWTDLWAACAREVAADTIGKACNEVLP